MFFLYTKNILSKSNFLAYFCLLHYQSFYVLSYKYNTLNGSWEENNNNIETLCFSCFSIYSSKPYYSLKNISKSTPKYSKDYYNIINFINKSGLIIPNYIYTCASVNSFKESFHLLRANIRVCKNGIKNKGICTKWKGNYQGKNFVYRECWDKMWLKPKSFIVPNQEYCIESNFNNNLTTPLTNNIVCFCGNDLCNNGDKNKVYCFFIWLCFILYFLYH